MADRVSETLQEKIKELKQALRDADDVTQSWTQKYQTQKQKSDDHEQHIELLNTQQTLHLNTIKEKDDEILVKDEKHQELMGIYIKAETTVHEARQGEKKAKLMVVSLKQTVIELRKQLKEQMAKFRQDVVTIYSSCDLESMRSRMEMEDALSLTKATQEKLQNRDQRIEALLKYQ